MEGMKGTTAERAVNHCSVNVVGHSRLELKTSATVTDTVCMRHVSHACYLFHQFQFP
jgi:hypothetical protein